MRNLRIGTSRQQRGAAILAFALALTMIAAISALLMAETLMDQRRINDRRRQLWRAFMHAEGGIAQVQHWALHPDSYTLDTDLWERVSGSTDEEKYPELATELASGGFVVEESELTSMGIDGFVTETGWSLGRIAQISILPIDPTNDPASVQDAFFKIVSLGESALNGIQREVTGYARLTPVLDISLPAPIISMTDGGMSGNAKVHWGEAWAKSNFNMPPRSQMDYALSDPLVAYRTESLFEDLDVGGWQWSTTNTARLYTNYLDQAIDPTYGRQPGLFPAGTGTYKDLFFESVPENVLDWPDFASEYETFKDIALQSNRYYTTDDAGNIYKNGEVIDFYATFSPQPYDPAAPLDLAFIDTTDGQPPAADGSNLATIAISGNNAYDRAKGFFYINANFRVTGVGTAPALTVTSPLTNADTTLSGPDANIFLDGVIYSAGFMGMAGNAGVYGALVAEKGFDGTGTPDVYYNSALADGLELGGGNLSTPFRIQLHNNNAPEIP